MLIIWVMAGGAFGAGARYLLVDWSNRALGASYWGVAIANLAGSLAIGVIIGAALARGDISDKALAFLVTGVLGGFTTFSAFSLDGFKMIEAGKIDLAALYMIGSVLGGLAAAAIGVALGRAAFN